MIPESNRVTFLVQNGDKILLLAVPYLATVSLLYYAGYWGLLGVDIYNYFALSDIIKGAAYPVQFALIAAVAGIVAAFGIVLFYTKMLLRNRNNLLASLLGLFTLVLLLLAFLIFVVSPLELLIKGKEPIGVAALNIPLTNVPLYIIVSMSLISTLITDVIVKVINPSKAQDKVDAEPRENTLIECQEENKPFNLSANIINEYEEKARKKKEESDAFFIYLNSPQQRRDAQIYSFITILIIIPCISFSSGYYNAKYLLSGKRFDYVEKQIFKQDSFLTNYSYLKYLGKAGDYHFLLTPDNNRRIIVDKGRWPTLILLSSETTPLLKAVKKK